MRTLTAAPVLLPSLRHEIDLLTRIIDQEGRPLRILEAGCGNKWPLKLSTEYQLTGIDLDEEALEIRRTVCRDLDLALVGDLRDAQLATGEYDVIYSSFVLEHVERAEQVLDNFKRWLKPNGLLIIRIPDPHAAYGFASRFTPFSAHVLYKRYIDGVKNAGQPGYAPYPVVYDPIVSLRGIREWAERSGLEIMADYAWKYNRPGGLRRAAREFGMWCLSVASWGSLSRQHMNLTFVIRKPTRSRQNYLRVYSEQSPSLEASFR